MIKNQQNSTLYRWIQKLYLIILLVVLGGIVIHAPLSVFFGGVVWPDYGEAVKAWKEILLLVASGLAVVLVTRAGLWRRLMSDSLIRLAAIYALLHVLLLFMFDTGALSAVAGLMIDLRFVLYFVLVYIAMRIKPDFRRPFLIVAAAGAALVVGFGLLQVAVLPDDTLKHLGYSDETIKPYITIDQNPDYVRINSTLRGPNPLGAYAVIVLGVVGAAMVQRRFSGLRPRILAWLLLFGAVVAVWSSYSRSALVAAATALLLILFTTIVRKAGWKKPLAALLVLTLLGGAALFAARDSSFVSNVILHENPDGGSVTKSNDEHFKSLADGTDRMLSQPLGAGVGSTGSASLYGDRPLIIENQYLFTAHESGWLGLGLFVALFGLIMWRLWLKRSDYLALGLFASGVGLSLIGLLLPVWVDDTVSLVWWGLAAVVVAPPVGEVNRRVKGGLDDGKVE